MYGVQRGNFLWIVNLLHPKVFFQSDRFNQQNFYATEAALNFAMMAYNFISLFRQVVLGQKIHQQTKTLRYNVFAIGG